MSHIPTRLHLADIPADQARAAARYVAGRAEDAEDCRELLEMLGLMEEK